VRVIIDFHVPTAPVSPLFFFFFFFSVFLFFFFLFFVLFFFPFSFFLSTPMLSIQVRDVVSLELSRIRFSLTENVGLREQLIP